MKTQGFLTDFGFGVFRLQPRERRLLKAGVAMAVGPRALDLLICLVERAGHLVTKDELFSRVWPKVVVDDGALQVQISALRKILGAGAIETISGSGYRFVMALEDGGPPEPVAPPPGNNLPLPPSSFVGREAEIGQLAQALDRARLVTLTGVGGCGKTRLAIRVAHTLFDRYPDGAWFVELAPLGDALLMPQAVMRALGVPEAPGLSPMEALAEHLASRRLLLILDNAEHLLGGCAGLADTLLRACRGVTLLVTSREKLGIAGELGFKVPPLSLPDADAPLDPERLMTNESIRLFIDRARLLRPHFAVTAENAAALASICRQLDGLPLAIELAAGRLRAMPVDELSRRLDQRFGLLRGGSDGAQRHRTLRSLIDWSYDLLSGAEQALLCRVSVFSGGCTLQAAEAVCSAEGDDTQVLDLLAALCDKNLVLADDGEDTRYKLLETVLAYARERLDESGAAPRWQARHLSHFLALAEEARPQLSGPEALPWLARLDADNDNLRRALAVSLASPQTAGIGMRIAAALSVFWQIRGHLTEARGWYAKALATPEQEGDAAMRAWMFNSGGIFATQQGDSVAADALHRQALAIQRRLGNPLGVASALGNLGIVANGQGDEAAARALHEESVAILRSAGDARKLGQALCNLGTTASRQQDHAFAQATLEESLALKRAQGDWQGAARVLAGLAGVATRTGNCRGARRLLVEALAIFIGHGNRREAAALLEELAHAESSIAPSSRAARLWGVAEQLRAFAGAPRPPVEQATHSQRVADARAAWRDDASFDLAWEEGLGMSWEQLGRELAETAEP